MTSLDSSRNGSKDRRCANPMSIFVHLEAVAFKASVNKVGEVTENLGFYGSSNVMVKIVLSLSSSV